MFPAMPPWEGLHPLVVHFPIALLIVAPVFVLLAAVWPRFSGGFAGAALGMMVLGTAAAFVATASGEAAGELAERSASVNDAIEEHEEEAELARNVFAGLTLAYAGLLAAGPLIRKKWKARPWVAAQLIFLLAYAPGISVLANAAHEGGKLVHQLGIHAVVVPGPPATATGERSDRDDD